MPKQQKYASPPRDDQSQGGAAHHGKPTGEGTSNKPANAGGAGSIEGIEGRGYDPRPFAPPPSATQHAYC